MKKHMAIIVEGEKSVLHYDDYYKDNVCVATLGKNITPSQIYLLLSNISKWTKTNKFPTKEFIMNILWYEWQDIKDNVSLNLLDMTKITYKNFSETNVDKEFYDFLFSYFSWISQELSDNGIVRLDDVHKKINELLSK
jgi:hypothetical protein